jgi:hypothetical protein
LPLETRSLGARCYNLVVFVLVIRLGKSTEANGGNLDAISDSEPASLSIDPSINANSVNLHTWVMYDAVTSKDDISMIALQIVRGLGLCHATMC